MFVFSIFFIFLYFSFNNGISMDNDLQFTLFGNLASMQDLFILNVSDKATTKSTPTPTTEKNDFFDPLDMEFANVFEFHRANLTNHTFDIHDYSIINEKFTNFTKQFKNTRRFSHYDYDDIQAGEMIEGYKKDLLVKLLIQFVMHARYEVGKALTQRDLIRHDKRYKLGYLFNRLRRLKTDQLKMVALAMDQDQSFRNNLYSLMRLYEKVVHYDVDMRDTCKLVKEVFSVEAPYDVFISQKKKKFGGEDDEDEHEHHP